MLAFSCATLLPSEGTRFSLVPTTKTTVETGLIMGTVNYGAGFYFPTSSDVLEISLLKTDPATGETYELSNQRIRNILNFPIQFTVRYDKADLTEEYPCTVVVSMYVDGELKSRGSATLKSTSEGFDDVILTISPI